MTSKARPLLKDLFSFSTLFQRMKTKTSDAATADIISEQCGKTGTPRSLNQKLKDAVRLTEEARAATESADQLRLAATKVQIQWDDLASSYDRLSSSIARVVALLDNLQAFAGNVDGLAAKFENEFEEQSKLILEAVEIAKGRIVLPIIGEVIAKLRTQRLEQANSLRKFAAENGLPADACEGLVAQ
jgi:hypothetical protein